MGKGGAEELLCNLTSEMSENHEVTLYLFYKTIQSQNKIERLNPKVNVRYFLSSNMQALSKGRRLLNLINYLIAPIASIYIFIREKLWTFDVIHINLTLPSFYMIFFKIISKIINSKTIYVQTSHCNYDLHLGISRYINILSWYFNDVFIYEIFEQDNINFKKYIPESKINYLPFGYSKTDIPSKDITLIPKFKNRDLSSTKIFMTISRVIFANKKIDVMLKSMHEYKKIDSNFIFVIGGDGADISRARQLTTSLGLDDNVIFLGFVNNVSELSVIADAYLVAIVGEDSGVSGMQAAANNVPVVGVQTVKNFKMSDGLVFGHTPKEIASLLYQLNNQEFRNNYLNRIYNIAEKNHQNAKNFTKFHESIYSIYSKNLG